MLRRIVSVLIPVAFGIIIIVIGCVNVSQVKNFPEVNAVVTKIDIDYSTDADGDTTEDETVFVEYTVDDKTYNEELNYAPSGLEEKQKITVRYNPEKPEYVSGATKKSGIIKIVIGAAIILISLIAKLLGILRGR